MVGSEQQRLFVVVVGQFHLKFVTRQDDIPFVAPTGVVNLDAIRGYGRAVPSTHELPKFFEEVAAIVWTRARFGVVLHAE